jgi:hypothetical protein
VAARSSASETASVDLYFHLLDSRDLVFLGHTAAEEVTSSTPFLFFEDDLIEVFGGLDE